MSSVLEQIEQQIAKLSTKAVKKNTGSIRTVADGVAKIDGLSDVMYNEMVQFPGGTIGIALNLEEDEVGCVVLGDISKLKEGDEVQTTGRLLSVPVGKALSFPTSRCPKQSFIDLTARSTRLSTVVTETGTA